MNKAVFFTIADKKNENLYQLLKNSLSKFHPDIPLLLIGEKEIKEYEKNYPDFFYKATPIIARELIDKYELVIKLDSDQIVLGDLNYILEQEYEVGTVLNINRVDPAIYGFVTIQGVLPAEYYNCGLVAMRSKRFIEKWLALCQSKYFDRFQYREQDLLNILCHFGDYKVKCFDNYDFVNNYFAWHGLVSKGEWDKCIYKDGQFIIPKGKDNYPDRDVILKIIHWGGGKNEKKGNYRIYFNEECIEQINKLVS